MGLYKGLSPTFDILVEKYFEISDPQNPDGVINRVREGKTARYFINLSIPGTVYGKLMCSSKRELHFIRFDGKLKLEHQLRESFTNEYGQTEAHIISENFRQFPIVFGLQKDSMFTQKFGEIIR